MISLIFFVLSLHPFHVSVSTVYFKPNEKVVQVEQSIFLDDLELALRAHTGNDKLNVTEDDPEEIKKHLRTYLKDRFKIKTEAGELPLVFLGNEPDLQANVMWCYWEAEGVNKLDGLKVLNTLLTETFDDQENIIHYRAGGKTRSERTHRGKEWADLSR